MGEAWRQVERKTQRSREGGGGTVDDPKTADLVKGEKGKARIAHIRQLWRDENVRKR